MVKKIDLRKVKESIESVREAPEIAKKAVEAPKRAIEKAKEAPKKVMTAPAKLPLLVVKLAVFMLFAPKKAFDFLKKQFPELANFLKFAFSLLTMLFVSFIAFILSLFAAVDYVKYGVMGPLEAVIAALAVSFIYPLLIWTTDVMILRFSIRKAKIKPRLFSVVALRALSLVPLPLRVWAEFADLKGRILAITSGEPYIPEKPPVYSIEMLSRFYSVPMNPVSAISTLWGALLLWRGIMSVFEADKKSAVIAVLIVYAIRFAIGLILGIA